MRIGRVARLLALDSHISFDDLRELTAEMAGVPRKGEVVDVWVGRMPWNHIFEDMEGLSECYEVARLDEDQHALSSGSSVE